MKRQFPKHFDLARETGLPMFLHCRNASADFIPLLRQNSSTIKAAVVHSFDGNSEDLQQLLSMDNVYIGINGWYFTV